MAAEPFTARDRARYWLTVAILPTPPAFDAPLKGGGSRRNIAITFSTETLEWCSYLTVKKIEDMFIRFDRVH